ncbi:DUF4388 domain-containing protein [Chamaesiphon sp. VAR_48_metabat_135_sub]|uniref:DUF4388 domain-containing protein n=1 Tax=Chamaesiphon sp. VAR_48_metabat_135_sub TaxID=2964699 RepID=UPI00286A5325|nr:DUF4388 domain-containing protein [Chamaesiphon sp. VAR_48_metabat_135_sub]
MSLAGYLSEYSLAEIFHFIQEGNKTGLLSIEPDFGLNRSVSNPYYLSFQGGRIMSVVNGNQLEHQGLLKTIEQRGWLSPEQVARLKTQTNSLQQPLGNYLKSHNAITSEQLMLAFNSQVIANICQMFVEVRHGRFKFDSQASLTYIEMTGLSLTAKQATLMGLRLLLDWSDLAAKLPASVSALQRSSTEPVGVRLDRQELLVWQLAVGEMSIAKIAKNLGLETSRVQQIGFRLSVIGLMYEVSAEASQPLVNRMMDAPKPIFVGSRSSNSTAAPISTSFLSNLVGFLKRKG